MPEIDKVFQSMLAQKGSDLHLEEGHRPKIRLNGALEDLHLPILQKDFLAGILEEICSKDQWQRFQATGDIDFAYEMGTQSRFRANYFRYFGGFGAIFRTIPTKILTLEQLEAPAVFKTFSELQAGLVLITGPTGSGKSTTLAAIINHINCLKVKKIITIEDPVEFVHESKKCLIVHREVGEDTLSFSSGLKGAMKSDADVILVGEMRDKETVGLALTATEMGMLVFGTLHTNSAPKTLDRITDVFPTSQQNQIRVLLSYSLKAIVSQQLLRSADGSRRYAAHEIMLYTPPLTGIIRTGDTSALHSYIQTGKKMGMQTMDGCLKAFVKEGKVSFEEAYKKALDKARFSSGLK